MTHFLSYFSVLSNIMLVFIFNTYYDHFTALFLIVRRLFTIYVVCIDDECMLCFHIFSIFNCFKWMKSGWSFNQLDKRKFIRTIAWNLLGKGKLCTVGSNEIKLCFIALFVVICWLHVACYYSWAAYMESVFLFLLPLDMG